MSDAAQLLTDVPLLERTRAARQVIAASAGLDAQGRGEVLAIALWPAGTPPPFTGRPLITDTPLDTDPLSDACRGCGGVVTASCGRRGYCSGACYQRARRRRRREAAVTVG